MMNHKVQRISFQRIFSSLYTICLISSASRRTTVTSLASNLLRPTVPRFLDPGTFQLIMHFFSDYSQTQNLPHQLLIRSQSLRDYERFGPSRILFFSSDHFSRSLNSSLHLNDLGVLCFESLKVSEHLGYCKPINTLFSTQKPVLMTIIKEPGLQPHPHRSTETPPSLNIEMPKLFLSPIQTPNSVSLFQ